MLGGEQLGKELTEMETFAKLGIILEKISWPVGCCHLFGGRTADRGDAGLREMCTEIDTFAKGPPWTRSPKQYPCQNQKLFRLDLKGGFCMSVTGGGLVVGFRSVGSQPQI